MIWIVRAGASNLLDEAATGQHLKGVKIEGVTSGEKILRHSMT